MDHPFDEPPRQVSPPGFNPLSDLLGDHEKKIESLRAWHRNGTSQTVGLHDLERDRAMRHSRFDRAHTHLLLR